MIIINQAFEVNSQWTLNLTISDKIEYRMIEDILFSKIGSQRVSVEALSDWKLSREVEYARWAFELSKREIRGSS